MTSAHDELHLDYETFSEADLKKVGAHKYAMHPSTEILCAAWAFNDEEPVIWRPGMPLPDRIVDHVLFDGKVLAWNANFERLLTLYVAGPKYGWPIPHPRQYECVMVRALAMALPGMLEKAAPALGMDIVKDDAGHRVMLTLCKPRRPTKTNKSTRWERHLVPHKYETLEKYCLQDVRVEQGVSRRVVKLKPSEQEFWWRDQAVNDRGIHIDLSLVHQARKVVAQQMLRLDAEIRDITGGEVASCSAAKQIVTWLAKGGVRWPETQSPSIDKDNVLRLLGRDDLTNAQRAVILLRQEAAKTSTAKLEKFETMTCDDGTIKGSLQFHGASTGRDAARGVQVQNFPRPNKKTDVPAAIATLMKGDAELVELEHGPPMSIVADCLRSCIIAAPKKVLITRDASQIEARMTSYLGNEQSVLEAFRRYDRKEGPDIYVIAASGIYNVPAHLVDAVMRGVGKVAVLALGFGGGAGAFGSMAKLYFVDLLTMFPAVWEMADDEDRTKALEAWKARGSKSGMLKKAWLASELVKIAWRRANPNVAQTWRDYENACIEAVLSPGRTVSVRSVRFRKTGSFLRCILPSGRSIFFPYPRLESVTTPWGKKAFKIYYKAVDGMTKRWLEWSLWGGLIFQNVVQATARDVLFEAVVRLEDAGYPCIMRVHDETISETDEGFGSEEEFHRLFIQPPAWAPDLPVAADGWSGLRYKK